MIHACFVQPTDRRADPSRQSPALGRVGRLAQKRVEVARSGFLEGSDRAGPEGTQLGPEDQAQDRRHRRPSLSRGVGDREFAQGTTGAEQERARDPAEEAAVPVAAEDHSAPSAQRNHRGGPAAPPGATREDFGTGSRVGEAQFNELRRPRSIEYQPGVPDLVHHVAGGDLSDGIVSQRSLREMRLSRKSPRPATETFAIHMPIQGGSQPLSPAFSPKENRPQ